MYRVGYASKSTSDREQILSHLREILNEARNFNERHSLTGVLYFADGYFFQCLEGNKETLIHVMDKIVQDARHCDLKIFGYQQISERDFNNWSMKYVKKHGVVQQFMEKIGFDSFKPNELTIEQISQLIEILSDKIISSE